jgi:PST family polysaccharide transporter
VTGDSHFFQTDTARAELRHRAVRSGAIAAVARAAQIGLQLGSTIVLARILTPSDFGIQAMVLPITILFNGIINLAFQMVLIQREELGDREASGMFWLGLKVNLVVAGLMALAGAGLSRVYRTPEVVWVGVAWAAVLYLASSSAVHEALLKRQLKFGKVWGAQLVATGLGIAAAVGAALAGAGHWALMIQIAVGESVGPSSCGSRPAGAPRGPGPTDRRLSP